jgi:hypothetical protein
MRLPSFRLTVAPEINIMFDPKHALVIEVNSQPMQHQINQ